MNKFTFKVFWQNLFTILLTIICLGGTSHQVFASDIRIADSKGDNGYPNPFRHYPRGPGYLHMSWVFETLTWKDANGIVPALATAWEYDAKSLTHTFKIRQGVKWHDGKPVTTDDVAFSVNYFLKNPYKFVSLTNITEAKAIDQNTVSIKLDKPYAAFISRVAGVLPIIPKHIWQDITNPKTYDDPKSFIGCGPYLFVNFDKAKGNYLYEAFEGYYRGKVKAQRLIYIKVDDPLMALYTHTADFALIKPEMVKPLRKKGFTVLNNGNGWNKKLMINHRKAPFNNKIFRKALAYAIDQKDIINKAHRGFGTPASYGLLSIDHKYYNPNTPTYAPNPDMTKKLLESLGYIKNQKGFYGKNGAVLTIELLASNISVTGESRPDRDGEVIKHQLERVGIQVSLINQERTSTDSKIKKWEFDLAISGHGGLLGDAVILNRMISPKTGSTNSVKFSDNGKLLKLLKKQSAEMDPKKRKTLVYKIQEIYADELPAISLYYPASYIAYNPKKGVQWYFTPGGLGSGIPYALNKLSLIQ
ncbi:MAG: ABC transporter substrate-binding protein [Desulfobulbaceae bacterium]|nr:ABC transporter substrate-binding protein [Desulfobulbaceae bacterium]